MEYSEFQNRLDNILTNTPKEDQGGEILTLCREYEGHQERNKDKIGFMAAVIAAGTPMNQIHDDDSHAARSVEMAQRIIKRIEQ